LLRLRSDEQLVALFRAGNDDAFRVIHDRYRQRLFAYARQMLPGSAHDAEDALQDIFVRAYAGLRASRRELALRAWLYRVAHNRCIDELRRPKLPAPEVLELIRSHGGDPIVEAERRESMRRLIADIGRLPEQQRSALLMRELGGMSYIEMSGALAVSVPAVKSLLVRARVGLTLALEARDTACSEIRDELIVAHDRGVRPSGLTRRHLHDCAGCREFRTQVRGTSRQLAMLVPSLGPLALIGNLLGFGAGSAAGGSAAGGSAAAAGTGGVLTSAGALVGGASHVATILAAAVVTAGGAVEVQSTISGQARHRPPARHARPNAPSTTSEAVTAPTGQAPAVAAPSTTPVVAAASGSASPRPPATRTPAQSGAGLTPPTGAGSGGAGSPTTSADGSSSTTSTSTTTPAGTDASSSTATGTDPSASATTSSTATGSTDPNANSSTGTTSGSPTTPSTPGPNGATPPTASTASATPPSGFPSPSAH
jgi:RNA polymerase sigma factor (sigma-70 family)